MKKLLLFLMLFCAAFSTVKATEVTIGDPTAASPATNTYLPCYTLYNYGWTQQIYTSDEIEQAGTIESLTLWMYHTSGTSALPLTIKIYMKEVEKESFASTTDWVAMTESDLVYAGTLTVNHTSPAQAYTFELDDPFEYDGTSNLLIAFANNSGSYKSGLTSWVTDGADNCSMYIYQDASAYDISNPGTAKGRLAKKNVITLDITPSGTVSCAKPTTFAPASVEAHGATLNIVGGSATYNVEYKKASEDDWTTFVSGTTSTSVTLSGLDASTAYEARVQCVCDGDATSGWKTVSFTTLCEAISDFTTAWTENFDGITGSTSSHVLPQCWDYSNTGTNTSYNYYPMVYAGATYANSGNNSLKFYSYYSSTASTTISDQYAILPQMENVNGLRMRLSARAYSTYDATFYVGVMTDKTDASTFTPVKTLKPEETTYADYLVSFAEYDGDGEYIAIKMPAADASHTSRYVYIDDIIVENLPSCLEPENLEQDLTELAAHTAKLKWSDGESDGWEYWYQEVGIEGFHSPTDEDFASNDWIDASDGQANITLTGLDETKTYMFYLRSTCGDEESAYDSIYFRTIQDPIAIPAEGFADDFESDKGWLKLNGGLTNGWFRGQATNNGGSRAMYIGSDNTYDNTSATMVFASKSFIFESGLYAFSFDWKADGEGSSDYLRVALVPADIELEAGTTVMSGFSATALPKRWIALDGGKLNLQSDWLSFGVEKEIEDAGAYMVVFAWRNDGSSGSNPPAAIDNFFLKKVTCFVPANFKAELTPGNGTIASLSWEKEGTETQWKVQYGTAAGFAGATEVVVDNTPALDLTGLTPETKYYARVRAVCGEGDESSWSQVIEFTPSVYNKLTVNESAATSSSYVPFYGYYAQYGEGNSQFILLADSLEALEWDSIRQIVFYSTSTYANVDWGAATREVYLTETSATSLSGFVDWESMTKVKNAASVSVVDNQMVITFDQPYVYTGDNLIIGMKQVANGTSASCSWVARSATSGSAYYSYKSYASATTPTKSSTNYSPKVTIVAIPGDAPSCIKPADLKVAGNLAPHSVDLMWTPQGTETAWALMYKKHADEAWISAGDITSNTFTLAGLDQATAYDVKVAAACTPDTSDYTLPISFTTPCEERSLAAGAYKENFDSYTGSTGTSALDAYPNDQLPACWQFIGRSSGSSAYPQAFLTSSTTYAVSGNCLFFKSSSTTPLYAILPPFEENISDLQLSFKYRNEGATAYNGTLIAGYMTDPSDVSTFVAVLTCPQVTTLTLKEEILFEDAPTGSYIAFKYQGGSSNNYYLSIDDVKVEKIPSCFTPVNLNVIADSTAVNSVVVAWTPNAKGTETAWALKYKKHAEEVWIDYGAAITTDTFRLTGLEPSTVYDIMVAAWCDPTDESAKSEFTEPISTITLCEAITSFPWSENFDDVEDELPLCWDMINTSTNSYYNYYPIVYEGAAYANSGKNSLKFYAYSNSDPQDQYAILPEMEGLNALRLRFNARRNSNASTNYDYDATFTVGIMTDPTDTATFVALATYTPASTDYQAYTVNFDSYAGAGKYIAIKMDAVPSGDYRGAYFDDFVVDSIPNCLEPEGLALVGTTASTAIFTYTAQEGDSLSYAYALAGATPAEDAFIGVTEDTVTIEGLDPSTAYVIYLRKECASSHSASISVPCQTKQVPADPVGFAENFEDADAANRWLLINGELLNAWVIDTAAHNGENSAKALYISEDGGEHHAYNVSNPAMVYASKLFSFEEGRYSFQYDWIANGESTWDFLRVALVPDSIDLVAGTALPAGVTTNALPDGFVALDGGSKLNLDTVWNTFKSAEVELNGNYNLVFAWRNDNSSGSQKPAAIDNISISKISCPMPTGLAIDSITFEGAIFSWDTLAADAAFKYAIALDTLPEPADDAFIALTDTFVKVTGLEHDNANYIFYLRHDCGSSMSASAQLPFTTKMRPADPSNFSEDFEGAIKWNLINGSLTNKWVVDTAAHNGGEHALYISNDGGKNNAYTTGGSTIVYATRLFHFEDGIYSFQYDWKANGEGNYDYLRVALVPASKNLTASSTSPTGFSTTGLPTDWISLDGNTKKNVSTKWDTYTTEDLEIEAGEYNLVFAWRNDNSGGTQTPAAVDNIRISKINCVKPTGLAVDSITTSSAFFTWDTIAAGASFKYAIALASAEEPADEAFLAVADTFKAISGLTDNTLYTFYLRQDCGDEMSQSTSVRFLTKQLPVAVPFADDFEGANNWALINGDITNAWVVDTAAHNGENSEKALYISNDGGEHNAYSYGTTNYAMVYAVKSFNFTDGGYIFKYDWRAKGYSTSDYLRVALVPDSIELNASTSVLSGLSASALPAGWVSLDNKTKLNLKDTWQTFTSTETHVDAGTYKVVFAWRNSSTTGANPPAAIDNFSITPVACARPSALETSELTATTVKLNWTNGTADQTAWQIAYAPAANYDLETATIVEAPTNPFVLTGLTEETSYYVQVRAKCGETDEEVSGWSALVSFTTVKACQTPDGLNAKAIAADSAVIRWNTYAQTGFNLRYKADSTNAEWVVVNDVDTPFVMNNLEDAMTYMVQVQVACKADDDIWSSTLSFTTKQIAADPIGFTDDFENGNHWLFVNGTLTNAWAYGTAAHNGEGTHALYISNNNGTSNSYTNDAAAVVYAKKLFHFTEGKYIFHYDWKANGEGGYDYLRVALVPDSIDLVPGTSVPSGLSTTSLPKNWIALDGGSKLNLVSTWQVKASDEIKVKEGNYNVVLLWRDDTSGGSDAPAAVDNFSIEKVACSKPVSLTYSEVDAHGAKLKWESDASAWQICLNGDEENLIDVTDTVYVLTNLKGETTYTAKVRANCGEVDGVSDWSNVVNFTTLISCHKPTALAAELTPGNGAVASLSWKAGAEETAWVVQYSANASFTDSIEVEVNDSTLELTELVPETKYYARVKAVCDVDDESAWSAAIFFTPTAAYSITINNGETSNSYVPFYGSYVDTEGTSSQFVVPATDLALLHQNDTIKQLTFYATSAYANVAWTDAEFDVYMEEVEATAVAAMNPWNASTKVMNAASLAVENQEMVVTLSTPYVYQGGNLKIGFNVVTEGTWGACAWVGQEATGAAYYSYTGYYGLEEAQQNFLPKMTIVYAPKLEATGLIETGAGIDGKAIKFIRDNHVYILVNGVLYDATGRKIE